MPSSQFTYRLPAAVPCRTGGATSRLVSHRSCSHPLRHTCFLPTAHRTVAHPDQPSKKHSRSKARRRHDGCQPKSGSRDRKGHRILGDRPRGPPVIGLRRGDIAAIRSKAELQTTATVGALCLDRLLNSLDGEASAGTPVDVHMSVEAVGAGYFVRGDVATRLVLSCDCCLASFEHPVQADFQVWLNPSRDADGNSSDPSEVPFPPTVKTADLSDFVREAIGAAAPASALCGSSQCTIAKAQRGLGMSGLSSGWSAGPGSDDTSDGMPKLGLQSEALRELALAGRGGASKRNRD